MKKHLNLIMIVLLGVFLIACNTTKVIPNVNTTKYVDKGVYIPVPSQYLVHCDIATKPIDKVAYLAATPEARELVWHDYSASLITDIKNCNVRIDSLKKYNDEETQLFSNGAVATGKVTNVSVSTDPPPTFTDVVEKAVTLPNVLDSAAHLLGGGLIAELVKGMAEVEDSTDSTSAKTTTTTVENTSNETKVK